MLVCEEGCNTYPQGLLLHATLSCVVDGVFLVTVAAACAEFSTVSCRSETCA